MIKFIFNLVANALNKIAQLTRLTYNEINIIVYYFLIPFSWIILLDYIFDVHYLSFAFLIFCSGFFVGCRDFEKYSDWLFGKSVSFLKYFNRFGSNYVASSVWICVSIPILIYATLFFIIIKYK